MSQTPELHPCLLATIAENWSNSFVPVEADPRPVYRNQGLAELTYTRFNLCCLRVFLKDGPILLLLTLARRLGVTGSAQVRDNSRSGLR